MCLDAKERKESDYWQSQKKINSLKIIKSVNKE